MRFPTKFWFHSNWIIPILQYHRQETIALIHLQGLHIIHNLAMNHRIILIRAKLSQISPSIHIQRKFTKESQKDVTLLIFFVAFYYREVLDERKQELGLVSKTEIEADYS